MLFSFWVDSLFLIIKKMQLVRAQIYGQFMVIRVKKGTMPTFILR